jgi:hypothetical protein
MRAPEASSQLADPAYGRSVVSLYVVSCLAIVNSMSSFFAIEDFRNFECSGTPPQHNWHRF